MLTFIKFDILLDEIVVAHWLGQTGIKKSVNAFFSKVLYPMSGKRGER